MFNLFLFSVLGYIIVVLWGIYRFHMKDNILKTLQVSFSVKTPFIEKGYDSGMFYFWYEGQEKIYVNGMNIKADKKGMKFKGSIIYPYIKAFYIPWEQLEFNEQFKDFIFFKNDEFKVKNLDVYIGFSSKYKKKYSV